MPGAGLEAAAVEAVGRRALAIPTDVSDYGRLERAADQVEHELGAIDVRVACVIRSYLRSLPRTAVDLVGQHRRRGARSRSGPPPLALRHP
jgi:NAD(P)-dependent dehydrogenase (short-subunit alcohol dehydrogenase family)